MYFYNNLLDNNHKNVDKLLLNTLYLLCYHLRSYLKVIDNTFNILPFFALNIPTRQLIDNVSFIYFTSPKKNCYPLNLKIDG